MFKHQARKFDDLAIENGMIAKLNCGKRVYPFPWKNTEPLEGIYT